MKVLRFNLVALLLVLSFTSYAASRYWIASSSSNWNNTANWSTTTGGAGGASVPGIFDIVYFDVNGTGICNLDISTSVDAMIMSAGTFNISTFTFSITGSTNNTFSGGTVNGSTIFTITSTGTANTQFSGTIFNPAVSISSPRIGLNGSTFNGTSYFEKTGASTDAGVGGNTFVGNCQLVNSGTGSLRLGNGGNDSFQGNLDMINCGSSSLYIAFNNSTTSIGGNLTINQTDTATAVGVSYNGTSSVSITGSCTVIDSSSVGNSIYLGNNGSITIGTTLSITNGGAGNSNIYLANGITSSASVGGISTIVNNDTSGTHRIYLGNNGDVIFNGALNITNNSDARNSQIYCNNGANSANTYNENINLEVTKTSCDGIYFGNVGGSGTLASTKTINIGPGGYITGYLTLRNFTQTGSTPQSLITTGTTILNIYDGSWGGNVDFKTSQLFLRGTTFSGTSKFEKTGLGRNRSYGGNTFVGNMELINSGIGGLWMGNNATDDFQGNLLLNNTNLGGIRIAQHSPGTTNIAGTLIINNNSVLTSGTVHIAYDSISTVNIIGATTVNNSGAGTAKRVYLGYTGDVIFNSTLTINNSSSSNNSHIYCNYQPYSHNTYRQNIIVESTNANTDGVLFGSNGGSGTLEATRTITVGGGGFIAGQLYFRNFTQTGAAAHTFVLTGTSTFYSYDSDWGGNFSATSPRVNTRGTTYNGTVYLEKTGSTDDNSIGGNTFVGNTELKNSGSNYFMMGNGNPDDFQGNLIMRNIGTDEMYIAQNSAGNQIAGNLEVYNTASGGNTYIYLNNNATSTLTIGGNCVLSNTGSSNNCNIYFNDDGTLSLTGTLTITNNSTAISSQIYLSNNTTSSATIGGNTTVTNTSSGTSKRVYLGNNGDVIFNGLLIVNNSSTATNSAVGCAQNSNSSCTFNENVVVESSVASCDGFFIGGGGGNGSLAATKTITIGAGGFVSGQLYFRNFTQTGATPHTFLVTGTGLINSTTSSWGGNISFTAPSIISSGSNYSGTATMHKTGSADNTSTGGNTYNGAFTFENSGSGYMRIGNGTFDNYLSDVTLINSGSDDIVFARSGTGHSIGGNLIVNNIGASTDIYIADQSTSSLSVTGNTTVVNSGSGVNHRVYLGNAGDITFNGTIDISNSSDATNSAVYLNNGIASSNIYNENILVQNTNAASDGIFFGNGDGEGSLATGKTVSINAGGFSSGLLLFRNFTQTGATPQTLTVTGTADINNDSSDWGGNIVFTSPNMFVYGTTFRGTAKIEKTGTGNDVSAGANTFQSNVEFVNSGLGYLRLGSGNSSSFLANVTLTNTGGNDIQFAYSGAGHSVGGNLIINNTGWGTDVYLSSSADATLSITGTTTVVNSGGGTYHEVRLGNNGDIVFGGDLDISNSSTATNSRVYIGTGVASSNITLNGNVSVQNTDLASDGLYFNGQSIYLASGKTISIKAGGFSSGNLYIRNLTQVGATPQSITTTGTSVLTLYSCTWNGALTFTSPGMNLRLSTFNADITFNKTGSTNSASYGGNTYNTNASVENSSANYLRLASTQANDYNGNLTLIKSSTGSLLPAYNAHSTLAGNLNINTNSALLIGSAGAGWLEFDGSGAQSINNIGGIYLISIRRLMTNNPSNDITLNFPININNNLNLTQGNIITTASNNLTMIDNAVVDAVSDNAYVEGPMTKIGNDAFTFPIGGTDSYGSSHYAGIGISAPSTTSSRYIAEYFAAGHVNANNYNAPLTKVSLVEYWDLSRTIGSGNINVTLFWGDGTRSGIGSPSDLRVAHYNGTSWDDMGNDALSGDVSNGSITANGISTFSPFTLGTVDNVQNPLPIDLLSFDVQKEDNSVRIDWTTASELNNDYFIIERTSDFNNIETVSTMNGAGNSNISINYTSYDKNPLGGMSYYRLVQVDYDGSKEEFEWKAVHFEETTELSAHLFPNPVIGNNANIALSNYNGEVVIDIMDLNGRILLTNKIIIKHNHSTIPLSFNFESGVYFIRITNNQSSITKRFIIK